MSHTHDVSWAAGFFDGEGYITIQERYHPKYLGYYLRIGINHVASEPLIEMQRIWGGKIEYQNPDVVVGNRKPRGRWTASTSQAAQILREMMPFFRNKHKVAAIALDFQSTIKDEYKHSGVPEDVQAQRRWYKTEIIRLNSLD